MMQTLLRLAVLLSATALTTAQDPVVNSIVGDPVCEGEWNLDHDVADSHSELDIEVRLQNFDGDAHFNLVIKDEPYAPAGETIIIDAWCIDYNRSIDAGNYLMDVFSAFDPSVRSDAVDYPSRLPALAWLINNWNVYDTYSEGDCSGQITWRDYQAAVWYVIDEYQGQSNNYYNSATDSRFGRSECIAQGLAQEALDWLANDSEDGTYPIDCSNPEELIPLMYIVDEGSGDGGTIENQVLMSETSVRSVTGLCECVEETSSPTAAPTASPDEDTASPTTSPTTSPDEDTASPTASPTTSPDEDTASPTTSPTTSPDEDTASPTASPTGAPTERPDDTPSPTTPPGTQGDPHFKTHGGEMYDFHGGCDLVLMDNPDFKDGLGMLVHIRTKIETWWSYVESSVVRIGDETVEITGGKKGQWLFINGIANEPLEDKKWYMGKVSGLHVRYRQDGGNGEARIYFGNSKSKQLLLRTFGEFVKVNIDANGSDHYLGSQGLLGRFPDGVRVGRDGVTVIDDVNKFGQEWQVKPEEPRLFRSYNEDWVVPAGQKCAMPSETTEKKMLRQRRLAQGIPRAAAEKACAHLGDAGDRKACVFDVISTQDLGMADSW